MQIILKMKPENELCIPLNYNYQLQSSVYRTLENAGKSDFWHDSGFGDDKTFKGFCFGKLCGRHVIEREQKKIRFTDSVYLEVRSPLFEFIDDYQRGIEQYPFIKLYDTFLEITGASLENRHLTDGNVLFTAETPVIIHNTFSDGSTEYLAPDSDEYFARICRNARKKYEALYGEEAPELRLYPCGDYKKTVTHYKGFYLTGYTGCFESETSLEMAEFIYNAGLGEKNSQGFGLVSVE